MTNLGSHGRCAACNTGAGVADGKMAGEGSAGEAVGIPAPVLAACRSGDEAALQQFVLVPANRELLDEAAEDTYTLMHCAAEAGHANIVKLLLANGATRSALDEDKQTPLHLATASGHLDVVKVLTRERNCPELMMLDKYQMTPFHLACESGHHGMVQYLTSMFKIDPRVRRGSVAAAGSNKNPPPSGPARGASSPRPTAQR